MRCLARATAYLLPLRCRGERARPEFVAAIAASFTWRSKVSVDSGSFLSAGRLDAFHEPPVYLVSSWAVAPATR